MRPWYARKRLAARPVGDVKNPQLAVVEVVSGEGLMQREAGRELRIEATGQSVFVTPSGKISRRKGMRAGRGIVGYPSAR